MKGFAEARRLERFELQILLELRRLVPDLERAFPVSIQKWGASMAEINGILVSNRGEFFFIDSSLDSPLTVKLLEAPKALDLVELLAKMGVVGNRSGLSSLAYAEVPEPSRIIGILPPPKGDKDPEKKKE